MSAETFPALLAAQVRLDGSRPLVTFYDDGTGERTELSVVTYANWVAKTASLLQDELGIERGDAVVVDLPTHWLTAVWLGAAWTLGAAVSPQVGAGGTATDLVVTGPDGLVKHAGGGTAVVALSLDPMGRPFTEPLPAGAVDYGAVVWGQPDSFVPLDPPAADDVAWLSSERTVNQRQLLSGREGVAGGPGERVMTDVNPCSDRGLPCLVRSLADGGGTVWVRNPDDVSWQRRLEAERVTTELRAGRG